MLNGVKTTRCAAWALAGLLCLVCMARAQTPGFHAIGYATGADGSRTYALSADGRTAVGTSSGFGVGVGFSWTSLGGRNDFGLQAALPPTSANAVSADGLVIAGSSLPGNFQRALVYSGPGTYQEIAPVGGYPATAANGISGDGSIVVGYLKVPQAGVAEAFRWTAQGGLQRLGLARPGDASSAAAAISRDGTTIVGGSDNGTTGVAFTWTQATGMVTLPNLGGSAYGTARAVNSDGSIVVGDSGQLRHAVMWRDGQVSDLGLPAGSSFYSQADAVNDLGTVVVGSSYDGVSEHASIWTPAFGMEYLSDYLLRNGVQVPSDWTLLQATAVSADGLTIAGWGSNSSTGGEGFVVTIPAPGERRSCGPRPGCGARHAPAPKLMPRGDPQRRPRPRRNPALPDNAPKGRENRCKTRS